VRMTRRNLIRGGVAAGAALAARAALGRGALTASDAWAETPAGAAPAPGPTAEHFSSAETIALLRELIEQRALASTDPWVEAHVILALGSDVKSGNKYVVDEMVDTSLRTEAVDMKKYPYFPDDIQRHPFHFLQIMQLTAVPYDRAFATPVGRFTRREIVAGSEAVFEPAKITDELSWAVSVLTHEFPQDKDHFKTARGLDISVKKIVEKHLTATEAAYSEVFASMGGGRPYARGIVQRTACNGTHMVYGLIEALRNGYTVDSLHDRTWRLTRALMFRMRAEPQLIDASLRGDDPMVRLNADAAKFTFLGHSMEDLGFAVQNGVFQLDPSQREIVTQAREQLAGIVSRLTSEHDLDGLAAQVPEAYKIILGDACHAYRGLRYWS
jgi:hypothetical protein